MTVDLHLAGAQPEDVAALRRMCTGDLEHIQLKHVSTSAREMGPALDLVQALIEPGLAGSFGAVFGAWLQSRANHIRVHIKSARGEIELESRNIPDPARIARDVERILR